MEHILDKRNTENKDLTRSSSSSMQTLRRILEIEEFRKFSDMLESKIDKLKIDPFFKEIGIVTVDLE